MIKAVVFDLDDTLIAGKKIHHDAIIASLTKFGYKRKRLNWIIGVTTEEVLKYNFSKIEERELKKIIAYKRKILKKYIQSGKPLPGLNELLSYLNKKPLIVGIITNNTHKELNYFLKHLDITHYFKIKVCTENGAPKPSTAMFKFFMKKTKLKPSEIIYVGDSNYDILTCNKAKIKIILNTAVHKAELYKKADFTAKNLKHVKQILEELIKN